MKRLIVPFLGSVLLLGSISCQKDTRLKWKLKLGSECTSPVLAEDGTIYVACSHGGIYAVNPDGTIKWEDRLYFTEFSDLLVGKDGTVYADSKGGCLWAINYDKTFNEADSLTPVMHPYYDIKKESYTSPAIDRNGTIYLVNHYDLYALDTLPHSLKWRYNPPDDIGHFEVPPAIGADGTIYLGSTDGKLYAVNPDSTLKWEFETDGNISSSPVIGANGTLYLGSSDSCRYAVNPDGSLKWKFKTGSFIFSATAIGEDGTIYFGCEDKHIYALSKNGKLKWRYKTDIWDFSSPVVGADGVIYIGPGEGCSLLRLISNFRLGGKPYIYAINPDGSLRWKYKVRSNISNPTLGEDGTLYFTCSKHLYALQTSSPGLANSPWPKFGADNQNTGRTR